MKTEKLTQWLRDNSSGIYRPAAEAANLIERLQAERDEARKVATTYADAYGGAFDLPWENAKDMPSAGDESPTTQTTE